MRVTVYALAAMMLSAWAADSGEGAIRSGVHGRRGAIDKKTAAAIGLARPHAAKGAQGHSDPKKKESDGSDKGRMAAVHKSESADPKTARKEARINGRSLSELGLKPPADPAPAAPFSPRQAQLQRIQAETQRLGGVPSIKPSPLLPAQPLQLGPQRNGALPGVAGTLQQRSPRTLTPLGGVAAGGNIGTLSGSSFLPRRR